MPLSIKVKANKNISGIYANGGWCLHNHKLQPFPLFRLGMVSGFLAWLHVLATAHFGQQFGNYPDCLAESLNCKLQTAHWGMQFGLPYSHTPFVAFSRTFPKRTCREALSCQLSGMLAYPCARMRVLMRMRMLWMHSLRGVALKLHPKIVYPLWARVGVLIPRRRRVVSHPGDGYSLVAWRAATLWIQTQKHPVPQPEKGPWLVQ